MVRDSILPKVKPSQLVLLGITTSLLAVGVLVSQVLNSHVLQVGKERQTQQVVVPKIKTVTALGRLEPRSEVIKLSAPIASSQGSRLKKLFVEEGDTVKAGQVIAVLGNSDTLKAAYDKASEAVQVQKANLAKVKVGAKVGEIDAQKAEIASVQAQSLGEERAQR